MSLSHKTHLFFFFFFFKLLSVTTILSHSFPTSSALSNGDLFNSPRASPRNPISGWGTKMSLNNLEGPTGQADDDYGPPSSSSFALAAQRTHRKDPLKGFNKYSGGWNLTERHYWSSVGYTAVPLFAVAAVWFIGFGVFLFVVLLCRFCFKRTSPFAHSTTAYTLSLLFLVIFTVAAIIGCVVLYTGQEKLHRRTTVALEYVAEQADFTVGRLKNVSDYLAEAKQLGVDNVFLPANVQTDIDQIGAKINASASELARASKDSTDDIKDLLDSLRLALIILATIMLILIFLGLLFSIFGMQTLVYILVVCGWLLVTGTFILCGTFLLLHNVGGDTCAAMNEWVLDPREGTAMEEIMPCIEAETAMEAVKRSKEVTLEMVDVINEVITNVSNINFSPNFAPLYFNQSGPLLPLLCNPFFHDLNYRPCSHGEVDFYNATQVWGGYVCQASGAGLCSTTGRVTPTLYSEMSSGVGIAVALAEHTSFLVELQDCSFAREALARIYTRHCPALRQYTALVCAGLAIASAALSISLLFWLLYARERRRRIDRHPAAPQKDR